MGVLDNHLNLLPDEDALFNERPEYNWGESKDTKDAQYKVSIYFPDINARLGGTADSPREAFEDTMILYHEENVSRGNITPEAVRDG